MSFDHQGNQVRRAGCKKLEMDTHGLNLTVISCSSPITVVSVVQSETHKPSIQVAATIATYVQQALWVSPVSLGRDNSSGNMRGAVVVVVVE